MLEWRPREVKECSGSVGAVHRPPAAMEAALLPCFRWGRPCVTVPSSGVRRTVRPGTEMGRVAQEAQAHFIPRCYAEDGTRSFGRFFFAKLIHKKNNQGLGMRRERVFYSLE